jgi:3-keto-disaccharide hydrolase
MDQHHARTRPSVIWRARLIASGLSIVLLAACGGSRPKVDEEGWQVLLNGSDLSGWKVVGDANWRIEERAALADKSTAASFLVSENNFKNFDLELEFWVDAQANSGVFLRCQNAATITDTSCYETNIFDTRPDQTYRTGAIVNIAEPAEFVYTGGQWNRLKITAAGTQLKVTLNDRAMVDTKDSRFSSGPIALQYAAGTVKFRNVRVREKA